MIKKIISKIVASEIIMVMLLAYASTIGIYAQKIYAAENTLEVQGVKTNNENVEFDAYFINGKTKTHEIENQIGGENSINLNIAVKNAGYLKNTKIEFTGSQENSEANFRVKDLTQENQLISELNTDKNYIELNQINKNEQANIQIPICFDNKDKISLSEFSKENIAKLTGTYVDANGKEKQIKAQIKVKLNWTQEAEIALEEQIEKYIPYTLNNQNGVMLQTKIKASILNNSMPAKEENIEITVPTIANKKPISVNIAANTTKATNGDENAIAFTKDNYIYNQELGTITITVKNDADEQQNITWNKNAQDEFIVTYLYPQEILNNMPQEGNKIQLKTKANITTYGTKENTIEKTITSDAILKDSISNIVDIQVSTDVEELSKGYIYANYEAEEKIETEYKEIINANIGSRILTDNVILYSNVDNFIKDENAKGATTVNNTNYAHIKELKIEKEIYDKFIGEEGYINLYQGSTLISTINKDTQEIKDKNIVVNLSENDINELTIITSKPLVEGKLKIELTKALKGNIGYSKSQMKDFTKLEVNTALKAVNNGIIFTEQSTSKNINFTEPKSTAEITINNENLSTVVTNKDIELRAILKTNSLNYNLYKNPSITITMPSYIENINVKNVQVLFDDELKIKTANLVQNADGTKAIAIQFEGTQTKYNIGNIAGGTNIVITADIDVNKLTPNTKAEIKMNYTNENTIQELATLTKTRSITQTPIEQSETSTVVGFTAPTGIVTMNGIAGYKEGAEELTSISGEEKIGVIDIMSEAKEATFNMSVMNNYNNTIENVVILGRTPFAGNKEIITTKELGSTMDLGLTTPITVNGIDSSKVTIYYSENKEATADLNNSSNGWTQNVTDLSKVKSYLIVTNNYVMNTADTINFTYNALIPENLQHNQSAYETYAVYFTNNLETGMVQDKQESAKVGVTTGKGPVLEAQITSNVKENEEVLTGKFIKYTVTVKNAGEETVEGVVATVDLPSYLTNIEFYKGESGIYNTNNEKTISLQIGQIEAGKSIQKDFWVVVNNLEIEETKDIYSDYKIISSITAKVTAQKMEKELISNEAKNTIVQSHFEFTTWTTTSGIEVLNQNEEIKFNINVKLNSAYEQKANEETYQTVDNAVITVNVPNELTYKKAVIKKYNRETETGEEITDGINYDSNARKITISLGKITQGDYKQIEISYTVNALEEGIYLKDITSIATIKADGIQEETSNPIVDTISKEGIKASQTSNIAQNTEIDAQDTLIYIATIENIGGNIVSVNIKDQLPKELQYAYAEYTIDDETKQLSNSSTEENNVELNIVIPQGKTAEVKIYTIVGEVTQDKTITNTIKVSSKNTKEVTTNTINHKIKAVNYDDRDDNTKVLRKISGQVWLDSNKDGVKDENESKLSNIQVMLINNETGKIQTENQMTSEDGIYTFRNIPNGKYTAIFLYDTANYSPTTYRKEGVSEEVNSDAIDTEITLDGQKRTAAITEEIVVTDSNIYNIDLGLIINPKFDLKLDKTVSKITIQNSKETKTYNYEDSKLAKRDIVGKEINSTTAVIEYKIKVTNEGAVSGYVKKIADYMPKELKFSSELNKDWYQGENGTLYNSSLANNLINPGESKEVTLILTKKLNENDMSLIQNSAEIYEAYNDLGLEDIDSKAGNKQANEDDYSSADVLFTVKTGETILIIIISLAIISTIAISAYIIKRKILR